MFVVSSFADLKNEAQGRGGGFQGRRWTDLRSMAQESRYGYGAKPNYNFLWEVQ
jgi:hypothetical protein